MKRSPNGTVGGVAETEGGSAEVFEAAVDRFGGSVAGAGSVEVGQHVDCTLGQVRPSQPPDHGVACDALAAAADRRQLAKRVQLVEGAMAALDHPGNDIVAPETDGPLKL